MYAIGFFMILGLVPAQEGSAVWRCNPSFSALFTPPRPTLGHYEVCTTPQPIETVAVAGSGGRPGAWTDAHYSGVDAVSPLDAFGAAGGYDRSMLARLYSGTRARVVRGWEQDGGRFRSITLVSPYPDPTLTRLEPGTLAIVLTLPFSAPTGR
jgi:hypothetical protein